MKQRQPRTLDEAVTATIKMETYLPPSSEERVAYDLEHQSMEPATIALISITIARLTSVIEKQVERVEKFEQQANPRFQQSGVKY